MCGFFRISDSALPEQFPRNYVRTIVQTTIFLATKSRLSKLRLNFFTKNLANLKNL